MKILTTENTLVPQTLFKSDAIKIIAAIIDDDDIIKVHYEPEKVMVLGKNARKRNLQTNRKASNITGEYIAGNVVLLSKREANWI